MPTFEVRKDCAEWHRYRRTVEAKDLEEAEEIISNDQHDPGEWSDPEYVGEVEQADSETSIRLSEVQES